MGTNHHRYHPRVFTFLFPIILVCVSTLAMFGTAHAAQTCIQPPPGIIAWWPLDEASGNIAEDKIGSHSAAYANSPAPVVGRVRGGLRFNGSNYLAVQDSDIWAFGARDFTIELWVNFTAAGGGSIGHPSHIFIGNDEGPGSRNKWFFALGGGYLNFHINSPTLGPQFFPLVPFSPTVGAWYHLAVVRRGTTYTIFINGTPSGSATNANAIPNPNAPLTIGQAENLGFVNSVLDEISIYDRALAPEEIKAIYDAGTTGKCISLGIRPTSGGDTGIVSVHVNGTSFAQGATLKLARTGSPDIVASNVEVGAEGTTIDANFDLRGKPQGAWNIVVTNPNGTFITLTNSFTVEQGRAAQVKVDIVGINVIRAERAQIFHVFYSNNGNVDAVGVPIWIAGIPINAIYRFDDVEDPPQRVGEPPVDWSTVTGVLMRGGEVVVPLLIADIPPGSTGVLSFSITIPAAVGQFQLRAWANPPLFRSPLSEDFVNCFFDVWGLVAGIAAPPIGCVLAIAQPWAEQFITGRFNQSRFWWIKWLMDMTRGCLPLVKLPDLLDAILYSLNPILDGKNLGFSCSAAFLQESPADLPVQQIASFDPNDKVGSRGGGQAYFLPGQAPLQYAIFFENLETATAPVQEVTINDQIDAGKLDLNTFSLGPIFFGNLRVVPPPNATAFATDVDLRPGKNLIVRTTAGLNPTTGLLTWHLRGIDPVTGDLPADPRVGFLPPDIHPPEGEGSVLFTVMPKSGLATGTEIRNKATIVFDTNVPIETPEWFNTLDNSIPESQVLTLPATQSLTSFEVKWSGSDEGAGIKGYTIYVSENGNPFTAWLSNTTATSGTFTGQGGKTYAFYSVAQDQAGNVENIPSGPDASTQIVIVVIPGDLNGDGRVDCNDLGIVRASFGKRSDKSGFDARADVNHDGIVDVRDLATVSRNLPAGTKCS